MNIDEFTQRLELAGLNRLAVLPRRSVGRLSGLDDWQSLLLIGNAGPAMWRKIPRAYFQQRHPVDTYARDTVAGLLAQCAEPGTWRLLFPGDNCPPLQALGKLAGWHNDSPLGTGINGDSGLWFAYRAVVAMSVVLDEKTVAPQDSPCLSCESLACVSACPATAVALGQPPDLKRCATYRVQPGSACEASCVARLCCPVTPHLRYSEAQINYHYRRALPALSQWLQTASTGDQAST